MIDSKVSAAKLEFLAAVSGVLIAIQARANGQLSHLIGNSIEAALISFGSGFLFLILFTIFSPSMRAGAKRISKSVRSRDLPKWTLWAGTLGGTVIGLQTHILPLIGVAIYSVGTISGQTMISLVVDRIGLGGNPHQHISARRFLAAFTTILAVAVSVSDRFGGAKFALAAVLLSLLSGCLIGVQRSMNGRINMYSKQNFTTSLLNFAMGTGLLILILLFLLIVRHDRLHAFPSGPWWIYLGGISGVLYIAFAATVVQHLGVLTFTMFSVGGQLIGALLLDVLVPTHGVHVSWLLVFGILISYGGVLIGGQSRLFRR